MLLHCRSHNGEKSVSLECYETISFGPPSVVVPHDARVCAPIRKEGIKQHLVIDVAGQISNEYLEL